MRTHDCTRRALPLRLTNLESRITPALSVYGPYTPGQLQQLTATGGDAWQVHHDMPAPSPESKANLDLDNYLAARLDIAALRDRLESAPMLFSSADQSAPVELLLPKPNGTFERFRVWEYSITEPGYVETNQTLRAYRGQGIDDPAASFGGSISLLGFHAQVLSPNGSWYIDPYWKWETTEYASYYSKDLDNVHDAICGVDETAAGTGQGGATFTHGSGHGSAGGGPTLNYSANAGETRTYRLAIASTAEFTANMGGVAKTVSSIFAAVDRLNQIYLNELSVRFQLVINNNSLIFTDTKTDGYTTGVRETLAEENQGIVDAVIGNENYDVAQVFDGSMNAGFATGQVGISAIKGKGSSGTTGGTVTEGFLLLFVHEMGHMFTASHTFNSNAPGGVGQYTAATAYEPGAGSTLMSYGNNGNMAGDNFNNVLDPYFHIANLDQMTNHIRNTIPTVGTIQANGNISPAFGTPPTQVIPAQTPFFLAPTGVGDSNGDNMTFTWEEKDLGPAQALSAPDNGSSPLFRSFPPSASSVRYFPRLDFWAANQTTPAEQLPTTNRTMHFDLTIRDNHPGGGGFSSAGVAVQVVNTGAPFQVTSQKFGASWIAGSQQTVNWDVAGTTGNGINAANVRLSLSTDGGLTYPIDLGTTANDGSTVITVPSVTTSTARIKVQATNQNFFAINGDVTAKNQNITIAASNLKGAGLTVTGAVLRPNREVKIDYNIANEGAAVGDFEVRFFLSSDPIIDFDPLMGVVSVPSLAANSTLSNWTFLQLPSQNSSEWNGDGQYYVGMFVDWSNKITETIEYDNINVGLGSDMVAITVTQTADDAYEENDTRETASTVLLNSPNVWLSSQSGKGIQHDLDYYKFVVPAQSTKFAHVQVDVSFDPSTGQNNTVLEAPPYYISSAARQGPGVLDFYGFPGDYYVYLTSDLGYKYPTGNPYDLRWTVGPDLRGPRVVAVSPSDGGDVIEQNERLISAIPGLKVEFSEPLTEATAELAANWVLNRGGVDISNQISTITYSEISQDIGTKRYYVTVDLTTPQSGSNFELRVLPGLTDADGVALDGNGDNISGDPFIRNFRIVAPDGAGPEQGLNQIKAGNQRAPAIAVNGSYVGVWESFGQEGDSATESNIHAQLFNDNGTINGPEFRVNQYTTGVQSRPSVASDGKGNFIVTWQSLGQDGDGNGVYMRRFYADGTSDNEFRVNGFGTTGNQQNPVVAMSAAGSFVIAYETNRPQANGYDIVAYTPNSASDFLHYPFNQTTTGDQTNPAVAMNAAGNYVVTWQSAGQDGSGQGIYQAGVIRLAATTLYLPESRVNETTIGDQTDAAVAISDLGDVLITWASAGQDGDGTSVYARAYQNLNIFDYSSVGPEFRVNQVTVSDQNSPATAMDADGDAVVTWQSKLQDGDGFGVYGRRYSRSGVAQSNEFLINFTTTADQVSPAVAVDADGDYFAIWQGQDGSGEGIAGKTYSVSQPEVVPGPLASVTNPGATPYTFTVIITDNNAVKVDTLGTGDIRVTGPNGFNTLATFVGVDVNTNGTPRMASYKFDPPGGSWGTSDNGIYSVVVEPNQIGDSSGNFAAAGPVGAIVASIFSDYVVATTADSGPGSLRQAMLNANTHTGIDVITFDPTVFGSAKTITLTTGEIAISDAVTIQGPGAALVTVHGNNAGRIFNTQSAAVGSPIRIEGMSLSGGLASANGGAILAGDENITLRKCVLTGNSANENGGAIAGGILIIEDSTLSNNKAGPKGGAISSGSTTIRSSTLSGNSSTWGGGAVYGANHLTIEDSELSANTAAGDFGSGGAIYFFGAASTFLISNCTVSGNSVKINGGGIALVNASGPVTIQNSTITGNIGSGLSSGLGTGLSLLSSTIIAGNLGSDVSTSQTINGNNNLIGIADNLTLIGTGNLTGTKAAPLDAKLGPLANNGGPTLTHALLMGSPAIDAGNNAAALSTDQRGVGFARDVGKSADIGAYEAAALPLSLIVNTTADLVDAGDGKTSLREAIIAANASTLPVVDVITFDPAVFNSATTITLTAGELVITDSLTINGPGPGVVTVSGNNASRVFRADGPGTLNVTLAGMTITKGMVTGNQFGAGVYSAGENLTLQQCVITGNSAAYVGGAYVYAGASLTVIDCQVTNNIATAHIGGLSASGGITVIRSTISGNSAAGHIGGIYTAKSLLLLDSTVSGNTAGQNGGGILVVDRAPGPFIIRNSTVSGNLANGHGGGIVLGYYSPGYAFDSTLIVQNSTITNNIATVGQGGGIVLFKGSGSIEIESSIVSGNKAAAHADISSSQLVTLKASAVGDASGFTNTDLGGNLAFGVDLQLAPLANNGGPTMTHALPFGSPAVNHGSNSASVSTDQRGPGFGRVQLGQADIGAFEVQASTPPVVVTFINNGGVAQHSSVTSLKFTFDQTVTLPVNPADAFQLTRQSDSAAVQLQATVAGNSVTLTFIGGAVDGMSLADGRYTLRILSSKVSGPGGNLDGNMDGTAGDDFVLASAAPPNPPTQIWRLFGDNDGDGDVDTTDFGAFRTAFGGSNAIFDFDNDGDVDTSDFGQFRTRFGTAI